MLAPCTFQQAFSLKNLDSFIHLVIVESLLKLSPNTEESVVDTANLPSCHGTIEHPKPFGSPIFSFLEIQRSLHQPGSF